MSQLLLPAVSLGALFYIAYRQWRTDHLRLKHERRMDEIRLEHERRIDEANFKQTVFDRRYQVYEKVLYFINNFIGGLYLSNEDRADFRGVRKKSVFLFDEGIKDYLDEMYFKMIKAERLKKTEENAWGEERKRILDEAQPILTWLEEEAEKVEERFKPYLHL